VLQGSFADPRCAVRCADGLSPQRPGVAGMASSVEGQTVAVAGGRATGWGNMGMARRRVVLVGEMVPENSREEGGK
jgi:NAD-dependent SIR2 family protein deacetylase